MSTKNNNLKQRQKLNGFESNYTRQKNPYAKAELKQRFGKNRSPDFLAQFLIKIYAEKGVGWDQLNNYISLHLRDVVARDPTRSSKDLGTARGNIMKELERGTMTWKNFVGKLRLIRIRDIDFQLTLTDDRGETTVHRASYLDSTIPLAVDRGIDELLKIHDELEKMDETYGDDDNADAETEDPSEGFFD